MKNQGVVKLFTIALTLVCLFHLSFTVKSRMVTAKADSYANGDPLLKQKYLDSVAGTNVYNLVLRKYTYMQVKERELNLGLDLQGGMNVTLEVSLPDVMKALANHTKDPKFNAAIEKATASTLNSQANFVDLFVKAIRETAPGTPLSTWFAHKDNKDKINFNSKDEDVIAFLQNEADDAVERTYRILRSRIDRFGVSQPVIQKLESGGRIMVELPGVNDPARARQLLQASAKLEFWNTYMPTQSFDFLDKMDKVLKTRNDAEKGITPDTTEKSGLEGLLSSGTDTAAKPDSTADTAKNSNLLDVLANKPDSAGADTGQKTLEQFREDRPLIAALSNGTTSFLNLTQEGQFGNGCEIAFITPFDTAMVNALLNDPELRDAIPSDVVFAWGNKADEGNRLALYALKASRDGGPDLEGDVVTDARSNISQSGGFEVSMSMNQEGKQVWKRLTHDAAEMEPNGHVAIVLDGVVYSAPRVDGEIPNGQTSITGNFTQDDTKFLANILKSGKLPAPARIVEEAIVGPSLGKEAIQNGLYSVLAGFISVILIVAVIYSTAGWIANIAVVLNLFFMLGVLSSLGAALTLPGIAGMILTLGMAVDANVLIYERVKEELKAGKNMRTAIANGYDNALSAILDSNITTLLTGFVLLAFGTGGPIYGFAVTLIIGIICSLFTAILLTRLVFEWTLKKDKDVKFSIPATANLLRNVNYNFMGNRKYFYSISGVVILVGLVSIFTKGLDLGVDFKGGWSYVVKVDGEASAVDMREKLEPVFGSAPEVKVFGSDNTFKITTDYNITDTSKNAAEIVSAKLDEGMKTVGKYTVESATRVGPTIADDIKWSAVQSVVVALILMFVYILIRFRKWQFATGTVIKLTHDVLIVMGLFSLLDGIVPFTMEIDQAFIAAILTVIGYSINDSVVVMDRVREFLAEHKKVPMKKIINDALNDTLSRTMITSLTTIAVLIILFIFGGEVIRGFSFAMLVGVVVGSYSSICIGAPLAADLVKDEK